MSLTESNQIGQTIKLRDGRALGYAEFGDPEGKPVFVFHGYPGSRIGAELMDKAAKNVGARLIATDRPGMGLSDFQPRRQILDWPDDVVELADALGIERFAVVGASGGGPYSAACAYKIPERLTACGIIAGMGPPELGSEGMKRTNQIIFFVSRRLPWLFRPFLWFSMGRHCGDKEKLETLLASVAKEMPEVDQQFVLDPAIREPAVIDAMEAFRHGSKGPAHEGVLYARPWGFELEDITFANVYLWQGELDVNVPPAMGRVMAAAIPNCKATFYPNDGHLSVLINHAQDILEALVS
jgi:pimeloyl-ACP methyl ester carboxylesterase